MNKFNLSNFLKKTFIKYPLDHSLNHNKIEKFIKLADPGVKEICRKIFNNTDHINSIDINKTIYILIDENLKEYTFKSNYWIFEYVKQYINFKSHLKHNIILINNINNNIITNNDLIVIIDDCIYSGTQMSETIRKLNNKKKLKLYFYILVPFISIAGRSKIIYSFNSKTNLKNYCKIYFPKYSFKPKIINEVLNEKEIILIEKYYNKIHNLYNRYLIYFDHKLADDVSTLTIFYLGVVPNQKNLQAFKYINVKDYANNLHLLDIVPVINKCDKYKNKIDINSPKCPAPPYKKNFSKFIKIYKKDIVKYKSLSNLKINSLKSNIKYKSL